MSAKIPTPYLRLLFSTAMPRRTCGPCNRRFLSLDKIPPRLPHWLADLRDLAALALLVAAIFALAVGLS